MPQPRLVADALVRPTPAAGRFAIVRKGCVLSAVVAYGRSRHRERGDAR